MRESLPLPRSLNRRIWRAIMEFALISGAIACWSGSPGGKDSAFLLYALRSLQLHNRLVPFTLAAVTLDPGFVPDFPPETVSAYAARLGVEWH